jgi:hypothetical protein
MARRQARYDVTCEVEDSLVDRVWAIARQLESSPELVLEFLIRTELDRLRNDTVLSTEVLKDRWRQFLEDKAARKAAG